MTKSAEYSTCDTPHGKFTVVCESETVLAAGWTSDAAELLVLVHPDIRPETITQNDDRCAAAISAVQAFYKGDFSAVGKLAVRQQSGPFRMRAWETLRKIPAGATLTYGEFAVQAGNPRAIRAAAGACAANAACPASGWCLPVENWEDFVTVWTLSKNFLSWKPDESLT